MTRMAARRWIFWLAGLLAVSGPDATMAEDVNAGFVDHLARQIICRSAPDPTPTLFYLSRRKRLDLKNGTRIDSETCWAIRPPVAMDGVSFTYVCASSEDPLLIELFPLLYYRGPGTSPGTGMRLVTNDDEAAVDAWIERAKGRLGLSGETKLDIGGPSLVEGKTEISCSSTSFPAGN